jgi:hypothetical protein
MSRTRKIGKRLATAFGLMAITITLTAGSCDNQAPGSGEQPSAVLGTCYDGGVSLSGSSTESDCTTHQSSGGLCPTGHECYWIQNYSH